MSKKPLYQASFTQKETTTSPAAQNKAEHTTRDYPNFTLVDPRLTHLFKSMCQNFKDHINPPSEPIMSQKPLIIDNQTGRIIAETPDKPFYLKKRHQNTYEL